MIAGVIRRFFSGTKRKLFPLLVLIVALFADGLPIPKTDTGMAAADPSSAAASVFAMSVVAGQYAPSVFTYDVVVYGGNPFRHHGRRCRVTSGSEGRHPRAGEPPWGHRDQRDCATATWRIHPSSVGWPRSFFTKVGAYYGVDKPMYAFEPHAAEQVFKQLVATASVDVFYQHRLKRPDSVTKQGADIVAVTTEKRQYFYRKDFH